jgi:hypothetical protein
MAAITPIAAMHRQDEFNRARIDQKATAQLIRGAEVIPWIPIPKEAVSQNRPWVQARDGPATSQ